MTHANLDFYDPSSQLCHAAMSCTVGIQILNNWFIQNNVDNPKYVCKYVLTVLQDHTVTTQSKPIRSESVFKTRFVDERALRAQSYIYRR